MSAIPAMRSVAALWNTSRVLLQPNAGVFELLLPLVVPVLLALTMVVVGVPACQLRK